MLKDAINVLFERPFADLLYEASTVHRQYFDPNEVQCCTLQSIKTGLCPEDCKYCSQSAHYQTEIEKEKLLPIDSVMEKIKQAKKSGATRFCMAAAWRSVPKKALPEVIAMIKAIKSEGLESCVSLGMLNEEQANALKEAGLDYYNHNLDTSREYYSEVISTRTYDDRLQTLKHVREAGIKVCCGGILGLGESRSDRVNLLTELSEMDPHPESVPINQLVRVPGTPFSDKPEIDEIEFVRTIAVARIAMPKTMLRLSAGRLGMSQSMQALCFSAGANSIFYGEKLLTTPNPEETSDRKLFSTLGVTPSELLEA